MITEHGEDVAHPGSKTSDYPLDDQIAGICLGNEEKMNEWINAITEFANCEILLTDE